MVIKWKSIINIFILLLDSQQHTNWIKMLVNENCIHPMENFYFMLEVLETPDMKNHFGWMNAFLNMFNLQISISIAISLKCEMLFIRKCLLLLLYNSDMPKKLPMIAFVLPFVDFSAKSVNSFRALITYLNIIFDAHTLLHLHIRKRFFSIRLL